MVRSRPSDDAIEILLAEDHPGDVRLVEEAFESTGHEGTIHVVTDGYEAIHFLTERGANESPSPPDLAILDLNLPGKDGCEVLQVIRADPQLRRLPVIVLTSSDDSSDIVRCYDAHANAYVTKPADLEGFVSLMEEITRFWFERVQLPPVSQ